LSDLFDRDEACEVADLVGFHQVMDKVGFGDGVAELESKITEAIVYIAIDVRVKSDSVHRLAGLTRGVLNEGHECTLEAEEGAVDPCLAIFRVVVVVVQEFIAVLVAVSHWITIQAAIKRRLQTVRIERTVLWQFRVVEWVGTQCRESGEHI